MLSVKIEFVRLIDIQAVQQQLFYTKECMCQELLNQGHALSMSRLC